MKDAARRQKILKKAEGALRRSLQKGEGPKRLLAAAEKLREAKLSLFKGQREIAKYKHDLTQSELNHLANLDKSEEEWRGKSLQEITDEFSKIPT